MTVTYRVIGLINVDSNDGCHGGDGPMPVGGGQMPDDGCHRAKHPRGCRGYRERGYRERGHRGRGCLG